MRSEDEIHERALSLWKDFKDICTSLKFEKDKLNLNEYNAGARRLINKSRELRTLIWVLDDNLKNLSKIEIEEILKELDEIENEEIKMWRNLGKQNAK